jgi:16S rRNA (guanine527-N7)-methyltransferase
LTAIARLGSVRLPHLGSDDRVTWLVGGPGRLGRAARRAGENRDAGGAHLVEDGSGSIAIPGALRARVNRRHEPLPPRVRADGAAARSPLPTDPQSLSALPPEFQQTLADGLASLGLSLAPDQIAGLDSYVRLLLAWTEAINLTAIREPKGVAREHLLDSLAAVPVLRAAGGERILDLGSGAGLPGLPIAIALPGAHVLLVESVGKKAAFLETAVRSLNLGGRVGVANERAEALASMERERGRWDAVVVRAVAALPALVELALPLLAVGGRLIAWKRGAIDDELEAGRRALLAMGGGDMSVIAVPVPGLEDHRLVMARKTGPTPNRFPRPPQERLRAPW